MTLGQLLPYLEETDIQIKFNYCGLKCAVETHYDDIKTFSNELLNKEIKKKSIYAKVIDGYEYVVVTLID